MKKIAICFSGGIRSFLTCYPSIYKNLILPLNPDIFLHLWSQPVLDSSFNAFKFQDDECSQETVFNIINQDNKVKDFVIDEFSPDWQHYIINKCIDPNIINNFSPKDKDYAISAICMYYKIFMANQLKIKFENDNNFKYDLVIRARLDFFWHDFFHINDFFIKDSDIILVKDSYCTKAKWPGNDKFFATNSLNMDNICNLYNLIHKFYTEFNIPIEGQHLNKFIIKYLNLNIKYIGDQFTYDKILASKRIKSNGLACFVYDCFDDWGFYICEEFLKRGFKVFGISNLDKSNYYYKILSKYTNFILTDDITIVFASFFVFTKYHDFMKHITSKRIIYFTDDFAFSKFECIKNLIFTDSVFNSFYKCFLKETSVANNLIDFYVSNLLKIILDKNNFNDYLLSKIDKSIDNIKENKILKCLEFN